MAEKTTEKKTAAKATKSKPTQAKSVKAQGAGGAAPKKGRTYRTPLFSERNTERKYYLVDVKGQVVGRAASFISSLLRGKHKTSYTPHADTGDFVIAINAAHVKFTGNKWDEKEYVLYSGYLGGLKTLNARQMHDKNPTQILKKAVWGMLPKDSLGRHFLTKLKVYAGSEHPHAAQKPHVLKIEGVGNGN